MKKYIAAVSTMLVLTSCAPIGFNDSIDNFSYKSKSAEEIPINFKIKKNILSKGYQSIAPNVELSNSGKNISFLVNLGIVECSDIKVDKVTRLNNQINIYTSRVLDVEKSDMFVPQFIIEIDKTKDIALNDLKFNIISTNYEPLNFNFDIRESVNNIKSEYNIITKYISDVDLVKEDNRFYWVISISDALNSSDTFSPLIEFNGKVDVDSGNIIDAEIKTVSSIIDEGNILDFKSNKFIAYSKKNVVNNLTKDSLWIYDILNKTKKEIYTTNNSIISASISPNSEQVAFVEATDSTLDIFTVNMYDNSIKKVSNSEYNHEVSFSWHDDNIYAIDSSSSKFSSIVFYDISNDKNKRLISVNNSISSFDVKDNIFLISSFDKDPESYKLYITSDGEDLTKIDEGFNGVFFKDNIIYLKSDKDSDINKLYIYDRNTKKTSCIVDNHVYSFFIDKDILFIKAKSDNNSNYSLLSYDLNEGTAKTILDNFGSFFLYDNISGEVYINIESSNNNLDNKLIHLLNNVDFNINE